MLHYTAQPLSAIFLVSPVVQQQKPFSTVSHLTMVQQQSREQSSGSLLALNYRSNLYRETLIKRKSDGIIPSRLPGPKVSQTSYKLAEHTDNALG